MRHRLSHLIHSLDQSLFAGLPGLTGCRVTFSRLRLRALDPRHARTQSLHQIRAVVKVGTNAVQGCQSRFAQFKVAAFLDGHQLLQKLKSFEFGRRLGQSNVFERESKVGRRGGHDGRWILAIHARRRPRPLLKSCNVGGFPPRFGKTGTNLFGQFVPRSNVIVAGILTAIEVLRKGLFGSVRHLISFGLEFGHFRHLRSAKGFEVVREGSLQRFAHLDLRIGNLV
mmetsp:Transcript_11435/g.19005  ORF Transcript_11435/g.19005 Transcript_11435/m.19005 type:complete len:226 (+) Transcript_11435:1491-2168(+)